MPNDREMVTIPAVTAEMCGEAAANHAYLLHRLYHSRRVKPGDCRAHLCVTWRRWAREMREDVARARAKKGARHG